MIRWIVASSESEVALLKAALGARRTEMNRGFSRYLGRLGDEPIGLEVIGVGVVAAAWALGALLASGEVRQLIMVGSAGAFPDTDLDVGDVAIASSEILAELGVCAGRGVGDASALNLTGLDQTLLLDEKLAQDMLQAAEGSFRARKGSFLSVVGVSDSVEQAAARAMRFRPLVENMEGYALALAGQRAGIPVAEVRGVSNHAGIRDKSAWNLDLANERAQEVVLAFCRRLAPGCGRPSGA
jgi:futalosine hydrolase